MRVLFVSYDGILEPLGESQVAAYLIALARDHDISLLSFEKPADLQDTRRLLMTQDSFERSGVHWVRRRYHKTPTLLATSWDVLVGVVTGIWLVRTRRLKIVHTRGYVPSLVALALRRVAGVQYLFDMRGFWADEKADSGQWLKDGLLYRLAKWWERRFFESADGIVSLTATGLEAVRTLGYAIRSTSPIEVIPTCTDLSRFVPGPKDLRLAGRLGVDGGLVIGCVGTMSNRYMRQPMLEYLGYIMGQLDELTALIVTHEDHAVLRRDAEAAGVPPGRLRLARATFSEMPEYIRLIDLGLFFGKPVFSNKGWAATKLGEFLATGVPVIVNDGVGDAGMIVREGRAGVVLPDTSRTSFEGSIAEVKALLDDPDVHRRCRRTAERWFDLRAGVAKYAALYERLGTLPPSRREVR